MTTGVETRTSAGIGIETAVRTAPDATTARKVLIVSYHFPPDAQVGAVRPAKFAKYLRMYGWTPYVLTVREAYLTQRDPERLRELAGIHIERTSAWPTVSSLLLKVRDAGKRLLGHGPARATGRAVPSSAGADASTGRGWPRRLVWHLRRYVDSCFELPDKQIGWLLPAVWSGCRLVRRERIDTILTSSPPATTALVGLAIAALTRTRLVTDLRDPWYAPIGRRPEVSSLLSDAIMRRLERLLVRRSTALVVTTDQYAEFMRRHHALAPDKVRTIWNGYDPEDLQSLTDVEPGSKFTIAYVGTFYLGRTPEPFLQALGNLVRRGAIDGDDLDVRFVGHVHEVDGKPVADMVTAAGLQGRVRLEPPVPYRTALRIMKGSHVLLLLAPAQYYCIPAKAFEYFAMGRQVLCLSPDGATADLVRRTGVGLVVEPSDVAGIEEALLAMYRRRLESGQRSPTFDISAFERGRLVAQLAQLLDG